jgi:hypothetical protein
MRVELVRDTPKQSGAITSKIYVDGSFFGYGLENNLYKIPTGYYSMYGKLSPTFKKNKVYIDVPGRSNIMWHGGNSHDQTKGCIIVAANRDGEKVSGDLSDKLFDVVDAAGRAGEGVGLVVKNASTKIYILLGIAGAVGLYFYLKKGR